MALSNRVESFTVTVPAGTTQAGATTTDTSFPDGQVQRIELDVPDGHAGLTGIQIRAAGAQYIPFTEGAFIVANDHDFGWDVIVTIDTGVFSAVAFNTDVYDHNFYIRFSVLDFGYVAASASPAASVVVPVVV